LLDQRGEPRRVEAAATETLRAEEARLADRRGALETARADRDARAAELEGQQKLRLAGGSYPVAIARAEAALRAAEATIAGLEHEVAALEARVAASTELLAIARELREQPRALEGALAEAIAAVRRGTAARDAARVDVEVATRELSWCEVTAPADGVVMKLLAAPGAEVGPTGTGIVAIYDPKRLQARVDVPLASAAGVTVGQDVEIRSEVLAGRSTRGTVIRVQHESDLLKNTLQVKVRLIDPDPILRPETLCRARFLAPAGAAGAEITRFRVPRAAVRDGDVFVIDPGGARRVPVETIGEEGGDVVVTGALSVTHRVALEAVAEGERVEEAGR
jgi:HlyD family secretion protein